MTQHNQANTPIAVVGLGGLFPGARTVHEFWDNVVGGTDSITEVPETHWSPDDHYDPDPSTPDKTYCKRGGFVPTVPFNPVEFGIPPNTLEVTDILQLLSLLVAKQTLADVGGDPGYDSARTGVVLGITGANSLTQPLATRLQTPVLKDVVRSMGLSTEQAEEIAERFSSAFAPWEENSFPGMLGNVVAGRIANRFDLGGMNCTVDAACASSLAAVNSAVGELASGRADLMLTGGCDAENTIFMYLCFSKTPAFSPSGVIKPFDANSDGTLIGEGIGMLALKRLADAERDGDRVYAVLRGTGTSSDGRFKSIYAPRAQGQQLALRRAYDEADVSVGSIGLVECHGTGTALGDRTELEALREVYSGVEEGSVTVGSVKSQIGHTKAAAGAASLIKTSLALYHKVLPPTINVAEPTEALTDSPFSLSGSARPWVAQPHRPSRRAAVSSFGFGGTNFHCVLQEHDAAGRPAGHRAAEVAVWHAPDPATLLSTVDAGASGTDPAEPVPAAHARLAVVGTSAEERAALAAKAAERIRTDPHADFELPGGAYYRPRAGEVGRIGLLCAGQGSQYPGMGASAALAVPDVLDALDRAAEHQPAGEPLGAVVYPPDTVDGTEQQNRLRRTENAQPAIGALSAGQLGYLRGLGLAPDGALGHSYGELTALWAAGALSDDGFRALSAARGQAMARAAEGADPGTMAALSCDVDTVRPMLAAHPDVRVCNVNSPKQTVVGGGTDAVLAFIEAAEAQGTKAQRLPVAAAFHTPYVSAAADSLRATIDAIGLGVPRFPVYANTSGAEYGTDTAANAAVLAGQLAQPVSFAERLGQMYAEGFRTFVEIGPRRVLSGLVGQTLSDVDTKPLVIAADAGPDKDSDRALKQAAARLLVLGVPLTGLNRYTAARPEPEAPSRMNIPLNGVNHVPEARKQRYRDLLAAGDTHATASPALETPVPEAPAAPRTEAPRTRPVDVTTKGTTVTENSNQGHGDRGSPISEHLHTHDTYLRSQLHIAEQLTSILDRASAGGAMDDRLTQGINAIAEHSAEIGRSHAHANDVLARMVSVLGGHAEDTPLPAPPPAPVERKPRLAAIEPTTNGHANGHNGNGQNGNGQNGNGHPAPVNGHVAKPEPIRQATPPSPPAPPIPEPVPEPESVITVDPPVDTTPPQPAPSRADDGPDAKAWAAVADRSTPSEPTAPHAAEPPPAPPAATPDTDAGAAADVVLSLVAEKTGYPVDMLDLDMDMEADLGIDSIKRVEIMSSLQGKLAEGEQPDPSALRTLRDIADLAANSAREVVGDPKAREGDSGVVRRSVRPVALPKPETLESPFASRSALLVGRGALRDGLAAELGAAGWTVRCVSTPAEIGEDTDDGAVLDLVLAVPGGEVTAALTDAVLTATATQARLQAAAVTGGRAAFVTVTALDGVGGLRGDSGEHGRLGGITGLTKTLAVEAPELFCRSLDLAPELDVRQCCRALLAELADPDRDRHEVGYAADGTRFGVEPLPETEAGPLVDSDERRVTPPGAEDLLAVTGGARGVTAACAIGLARAYGCGLLLLGRTTLHDDGPALAEVADADLQAAVIAAERAAGRTPAPKQVRATVTAVLARREIRGTLRAITEAGGRAEYLAVDVTDTAATRDALAPYRDRITGLVHGAGVLTDQLVTAKTTAGVERTLSAKLAGLDGVLAGLRREALRHVVLFSSVAGFYGNRGQADYAVANSALDRAATTMRAELPAASVTSVVWGAWDGGMVTPELAEMFRSRGVSLIPLDAGVRQFVAGFAAERSDDVVRLVGSEQPLSTPDTAAPEALRLTRDLTGLADDPAIRAHVVGGAPVLPLTAVLGLAHRVAAATGTPFGAISGASVFRGVLLDDTAPTRLRLDLRAAGELLVSGEDGPPRYRVTFGDAQTEPAHAPALGGAAEEFDPYTDGTLFHGERLRGITGLLAQTPDSLSLHCELGDDPTVLADWRTAEFSPVLADQLAQAALVWVRRTHGRGGLPTAVGAVTQWAPLPSGQPWRITVTGAAEHDTGAVLRCTVDAYDAAGRPLMRMNDVQVTCMENFAAGFPAAA